MPDITFDVPSTVSAPLNTITQGGFFRLNGEAFSRTSGSGTTIDTTNLSTGAITSRAGTTLVEPMTLLTASFSIQTA